MDFTSRTEEMQFYHISFNVHKKELCLTNVSEFQQARLRFHNGRFLGIKEIFLSFLILGWPGFPLFCFPLEITNFLIAVKTILGSAGCIILFSSECRTWCCVKENVRSDRHHAEFLRK